MGVSDNIEGLKSAGTIQDGDLIKIRRPGVANVMKATFKGAVNEVATTQQLLYDYTGANLTLDATDPESNTNWFNFDLTGLDAPTNGYRLIGNIINDSGLSRGDKGFYIDANEGDVEDPYNNGTWDNTGTTLNVSDAGTVTGSAAICAFTTVTANILVMRFIQDLYVDNDGTNDIIHGSGIWFVQNASASSQARVYKNKTLTTTNLNGKFDHLRYFETLADGTGFDLKTRPLVKHSIQLYSF